MWKVYKFDNNAKHFAIVDFRFDFMPFPSKSAQMEILGKFLGIIYCISELF